MLPRPKSNRLCPKPRIAVIRPRTHASLLIDAHLQRTQSSWGRSLSFSSKRSSTCWLTLFPTELADVMDNVG